MAVATVGGYSIAMRTVDSNRMRVIGNSVDCDPRGGGVDVGPGSRASGICCETCWIGSTIV